jgi:hypothetical protein
MWDLSATQKNTVFYLDGKVDWGLGDVQGTGGQRRSNRGMEKNITKLGESQFLLVN